MPDEYTDRKHKLCAPPELHQLYEMRVCLPQKLLEIQIDGIKEKS